MTKYADNELDRVYQEIDKLDKEKRNKSECELVKFNCAENLKKIDKSLDELKEISQYIKDDNIKINTELENISEKVNKLEQLKEKKKWFKIETIRRFILIIMGSLSALFIPLFFNLLKPSIIEFLKSLLEGVM